MFYLNLNLASTYFLALIVFGLLSGLLLVFRWYRSRQEGKPLDLFTEEVAELDRPHQLQSLLYNIFIAGLTFSGFCCVLGIFYNPHSQMTLGGAFYVLGITIYAAILYTAVRDFAKERTQCHKLRVVAKATLFAMMTWSPVPLFAGVAVIDSALMIYEYRVKSQIWVVPKCWLLNQVLCLVACGFLIFFNNMLLGLIISSLAICVVVVSDLYLHYREHQEMKKILHKMGNSEQN